MDDTRRAVSMDFKQVGDLIYIIGQTRNELGGSEYYALSGQTGRNVPRVDASVAKKLMESLSRAMAAGFVTASHDLSEGGLGIALADMGFAGALGAEIDLAKVPADNFNRDDSILFSESNTRFLAEVRPEHQSQFERIMAGNDLGLIGKVTTGPSIKIIGLNGTEVVNLTVSTLKEAWQRPLRW